MLDLAADPDNVAADRKLPDDAIGTIEAALMSTGLQPIDLDDLDDLDDLENGQVLKG